MKILKKIIWDFHTKNILTRNGERNNLNTGSDICEVLFETLLLIALCFIVYAVIVGLPAYFISAIILCCFVGRGEMLYVDVPVDLLLAWTLGAVVCGGAYLMWVVLSKLFQIIRAIYKKLSLPTFKVKGKVCFKVDFSDVDKHNE